MNTELRFVRCPRCRKVLPEYPDIPVYKCGGCGAVLQAKSRKNDINGTELSPDESNSFQKNENDSVSDSSNQEATVPYVESSPGSDNNKGGQIENGNHNTEQPGDTNFSDELSGSTKLCSPGNDKLCLEVKESIEQDEQKSSLGQDARRYGNMSLDRNHDQSGERNSFDELPCSNELSFRENVDSSPQMREPLKRDEDRHSLQNTGENDSQDGCSEWTGEGKFSAELPSSTQLTCLKIETSSSGVTGCVELDRKNNLLEQCVRDQDECEDHKGEIVEDITFLAKVPSLSEGIHHQSELSTGGRAHTDGDESRYLPQQNNEKSQQKYPGQIGVSSEDASFSREASSATVVACHKVEKSLMEVNALIDMDEDQMSNFKRLDVEGSLSPKKGEEIFAAQSPASERTLSEDLSPDNKHLEQSQDGVQGIEHVSSVDTMESLPLNPRPQLGSLSKSPTRTYYASDASASSYEGTDDQFSDQYSHLYERKFKATGFLSTKKSSRKDGHGVKKTQNRELEMHRQPTNSSSMFTGENNHGITGGDWGLDELPEPRTHRQAIRSRRRLDKHDHGSRMPYISRSSQLVHGNGSPSSYQHNVFQQRSGFSPPDTTTYGEPEKMQLLRMVYELEDKIKQTHISQRIANGRFSAGHLGKEKHASIYYDDLATKGHVYADFRCSTYAGSYTHGKGWSQQPKVSRMAFSGKAAHCRHQVDCLCSLCCHQDWQCSTQLPSHSIDCTKCQYMTHPSHSCHNAIPSCSSSPRHHISSEFPSRGRDKGKHNERDLKRLYLGEKLNVAKRHVLPVAAGSPIIACCHCSELLQLPMDFLLFKKRCCRLRCNSCYRILKFSLQKGSYLVPYVPDAPAPPPSEMDDNSGATNSRTMATTSHSNHYRHAEPASCSDDYGPSYNGRLSSGDSFEPMSDGKMKYVTKKSQNVKKNSVQTFESVGPSSKMSNQGKSSSEIQELPATSGSPLHRLMGYSSPSCVLQITR